jgi:single-strand DNA-binding protein
MAVVEGRLQIRDWTDKEGGKRRSAEIVADNVYFGDSKPDSKADGGNAPGNDDFWQPEGSNPDFG